MIRWRKSTRSLLRRLATGLVLAFVVSVLAGLLLSDATWRADNWVYDQWSERLAAEPGDNIVIVSIDQKSVTELGSWPWSRRRHAALIDRLTALGVEAIGLNILFTEPSALDPDADALLARAIADNGRTVLPVYAEADSRSALTVELLPIPELASVAAGLGHVDQAPDADGVTRHVFLKAGLGTPHWPSMALALQQLDDPGAFPHPPSGRIPEDQSPASVWHWVRDHRVLLSWSSPPDGFARVSYVDVLNDRVPGELLAGRWALVGVELSGLGDQLIWPGWRVDQDRLSGVEFQANALDMLLAGRRIDSLGSASSFAISIGFLLIPMLWVGVAASINHRRPFVPLVITLLSAGLALLLSLLLFKFAMTWFPPVPVILALGLLALISLSWMYFDSRRVARIDALTGTATRMVLDEALSQELRLAKRNRTPLTLLMIDVDRFKRLNDGYGHAAGDAALRALADVLRQHVKRSRVVAARMGGDEFALLLPETSSKIALDIARDMLADFGARSSNMAESGAVDDGIPPFTISIGVYTHDFSDDGSLKHIYERADSALYQAKQRGRNRSYVYRVEDHAAVRPMFAG